MKTAPDTGQQETLDSDSMQVFELLEQSREQYSEYLRNQESHQDCELNVPTAEDYTWDKPLTIAFSR